MSRIRGLHMGMVAAVVGVLGCLAVAGCGSTDAASGTVTAVPSGKSSQQALQFSQCMRAHGVTNFPDPTGRGIQITPGSGINPQSPAFQTAQKTCDRYLPNDGQPPVTSAGSRAAALEFSKCMRAHGVPDFPDPLTTSPSSPPAGAVAILDLRGMAFELGPGINPQSPAFQQAASDCGIRLPKGQKPVAAP
ncbi:MAG: hypothetical protein ACLP4R_00290 [Solirubrobacteraceae bacterium]